MKYILLVLAAGLSACATSHDMYSGATPEAPAKTSQAPQLNGDLHTLSSKDAPYWDLVSFTGFEQALRTAYDTDSYNWSSYGETPMNLPDIDFDQLNQVSGFARVYGHEDSIIISFQSCNGISTRYSYEHGELVYRRFGQTMRACERTVIDKAGRASTVYTPMLTDDWYMSIAPKIKGYAVSGDGQTLTLNDENQDVLAVFSYRGELVK